MLIQVIVILRQMKTFQCLIIQQNIWVLILGKFCTWDFKSVKILENE